MVDSKQKFDVAIWWPESAYQLHNNIDVYLINPAGATLRQGTSEDSIFERTGIPGSLTSGNWTIRVRGETVRTQSQTVYWAASVRNLVFKD